jgi:hypothetical protein
LVSSVDYFSVLVLCFTTAVSDTLAVEQRVTAGCPCKSGRFYPDERIVENAYALHMGITRRDGHPRCWKLPLMSSKRLKIRIRDAILGAENHSDEDHAFSIAFDRAGGNRYLFSTQTPDRPSPGMEVAI